MLTSNSVIMSADKRTAWNILGESDAATKLS